MKDNNNKRSVIIVVVILVALLLLFALIRGCDKKEEPKKKQKTNNNDITNVVTDDTSMEDEMDYYVETVVPKATPVVNKVEKKEQILTLNLVGEDVVYVDFGQTYDEEGALAFDTVDGTITDKVERKVYLVTAGQDTEEIKTEVEDVDTTVAGAKYEIVYSVTNSNGETKIVSRTIVINDVKSTEFALIGNREVEVELGDIYTEEGTRAVEIINGVENALNVTVKYFSKDPLTFELTEIDSIDTNALAYYVVEYEVTDSNGMTYKLSRNITVVDTTAPVVTVEKDTYIYAVKALEETLALDELFNVEDKDTNLVRNYIITNTLTNTVVDEIPLNVVGEYTVEMTASDSSNNTSDPVTITVIVREDSAPIITLSDTGWVVVDENNITFVANVNVEDDYPIENVRLYYKETNEIDWTEITNNRIEYTYLNDGTSRQLLVKAVDEAGNETIVSKTMFNV